VLLKARFAHTVTDANATVVTRKDGSPRLVYTKTFHDTRRTAARSLARAGVREGVAMSVTGHRTRWVFDRYNITSSDDVREAMEAVKQLQPTHEW